MLILKVGAIECFDEETSRFTVQGGFDLELEHSLVALSKWESLHKKPFLTKEPKSFEELKSYIKGMILNPIYPQDILDHLTKEQFDKITSYIESTESATTFPQKEEGRSRRETVTAELIYYWMVVFNINIECQTWHLNRLFSLLRIASIKNSKPKKMSPRDLAARNRRLNEERKRQYNTSG